VQVKDETDQPLESVPVTFSVIEGSGSMDAGSAITDVDGLAAATLTLGPNPGMNTVEVAAACIDTTVTFEAIALNSPPVADAGGPYLGAVGSPIVFDGTGSSDPDGTLLDYEWDFGDGIGSASLPMPDYTYVTAGIYDVCLTVTDGDLSDTACTKAVVYDPSAGFVTGGGWFNQPESPSFNGHYYELIGAPGISWEDAKIEASELSIGVMSEVSGGHLVTITSQEEQDFLNIAFGGSLQEKWYGGYQDPDSPALGVNWHWITNEPWDYTNWNDAEPNDHDYVENNEEQYLMGWNGGMFWNDGEFGTDLGGYVVEYEGGELFTGKATFGFVAKYLKKGTNEPTGETEFHFHTVNLNFHSSSYDWLVVNQGGTNAQFKGSGTINGEGNYKFMLWAGDDDPDTFRIKIWEENGVETVVYDNGFEQDIDGGSIVIHTK
jgi:PKD repeat protein